MATDALTPILAQMLVCVEQSLTKPVALATIAPGTAPVWDECCEGELWVRVISIQGSTALSNPSLQPCLPIYQCQVGIGVLRCAHVIDDAGEAPTAAQMTADATATFQDMADVVEGLVCCFRPKEIVSRLLIEQWQPLGVEGGCVGGEVNASFSYQLCQDCEQEETP